MGLPAFVFIHPPEIRFVLNSDIEESYPLTSLQEGMLFNHESAPGSGVDIVQIVCSLDEGIDAVVLGEAWQSVLDRNPVGAACGRLRPDPRLHRAR